MSEAFALTEDQQLFRREWRRLFEEKFTERAAEIDRTGEFPWDNLKVLAEAGLTGINIPEAYGGAGADSITHCLLVEEVARVCASTSLIPAVNKLATLPLLFAGTEEQKQRFLPRCAAGEWTPAFALSEPDAGSDPGGMRTRARKEGSEWVIDGTKNWITNLGIADFYIVFCVTDHEAGHSHGISAFVVEADRTGFSVGKLEHKMGIRGSPTGQPMFDGVRVPEENLIGTENEGFKVAMSTLDRSRLGVAAQAVGIAQGATDYAAGYARERQQFGKPIASFQGIQFKLADMESRTAAARELLYRACAKVDAGERDMGKYSAMAKLIASDNAMWVTTEAVQVLGGYGYVNEYPVERMMRDAKITQIYEGTNEIQRLVIARAMR